MNFMLARGMAMVATSEVSALLTKKQAQTAHQIHELLHKRWSPRMFSAQPIAPETLGSLFEAARWAPSSRNEQPWRFIVASQDQPEVFERAFGCLTEGNQRWAHNVPILMFGIAKRNFEHNDRPNAYAWYDLGQAMTNLTVQASAEGLYVHQMGGFQKDCVRIKFNIPEEYEPVVAVAIGYLGNLEQLSTEARERELMERTRKPLTELVFDGAWGNPLSTLS
jgi:nitroreductase